MIRDVLKFGGEALRDGAAVRRAARIVAADVARGDVPVVVVSAHAGVTDLLEETARRAADGTVELDAVRVRHRSILGQLGLAAELLDSYWRELAALLHQVCRRGALGAAELDHVLSFGERLSARIVARALDRAGVSATPVDAWDLGLLTDSNHGRARPLEGIGAAVRAALLEVPGVPVVTGFLARDRAGRATTLGRDGSDLTAALLAEAVGARELRFWKTVEGILSADPRLVPGARRLDAVTYAEAAELAFHGARVLHPASVAPAIRARVAVRVGNVLEPDAPGTVFAERLPRAAPISIASRAEVLGIELDVESPEHRTARAARLLAVLAENGVGVHWIAAEGERVCALVDQGAGVPAALAALGPAARSVRGMATLAMVGEGVGGSARLEVAALGALVDEGIRVLRSQGSTRAASLAFAVDAKDLPRAVRRLHDELIAPAPVAGGPDVPIAAN